MSASWIRVTRADPCPICHKPDWCCVGTQFVNCMRIESSKRCINGGFLHSLGDQTKLRPLPPKADKAPTIDAAAIMRTFPSAPCFIERLATGLGVNMTALLALGCAWAAPHNAYAFPMKAATGETIGIRLRDMNGAKWAVKGSRAGLFYAEGESRTVLVLEGPTDTAAAMTIGLSAIGRPSCIGGEALVVQLLRRKKAARAVIVSDNDSPGYQGAERLQSTLPVPSVILVPPAKDLRASVKAGLTAQLIESLTSSLIWTQPTT